MENSVEVVLDRGKEENLDEATLERLSTLTSLEYDRVRKDEAKLLEVNVSTLDKEVKQRIKRHKDVEKSSLNTFSDIDPWDTPVNVEELLTEMSLLINELAVVSEHANTAIVLWIVFTWCIDYVDTAPILTLSSPEKQCGKTTILSIIIELVFKPLPASNITAAALFRTIESWQPTLVIDEADTFIRSSDELRGVLNSGHTRSTAYVIRTVGDDYSPKQFSTWGAKVIALIGELPETLHDRSIVIELQRKPAGEKIKRVKDIDPQLLNDLQRKLLRVSQDNESAIKNFCLPFLPSLSNRAADNWEPLLSIANLAGSHWFDKARNAAVSLSNRENESLAKGTQLLSNILEIFHRRNVEKLSTAELIKELCAEEELPWSTYNKGTAINPQQVAKILKQYKITSKNIRTLDKNVLKGFEKEQFEDAWSRYLPQGSFENAATSLQISEFPRETKDHEEFLSATDSATTPALESELATEETKESVAFEGEL
jgi:putative DNA primase/helicase